MIIHAGAGITSLTTGPKINAKNTVRKMANKVMPLATPMRAQVAFAA